MKKGYQISYMLGFEPRIPEQFVYKKLKNLLTIESLLNWTTCMNHPLP